MPKQTSILFCHCAGREVLPDQVKRAVLAGLRARGTPFVDVGDLCGLAAARDPSLRDLARSARKFVVVACRPRAVKWLLHAAGAPAGGDGLQVLDMRAMTAEAVLAQLPGAGPAAPAPEAPPEPPPSEEWPPWFPVIDYDRCRQCRQCLSFCLFGVYELSPDNKVTVARPRECKNNCPACARICPEVAIMFPKLGEAEGPLNGAEIENEADLKARARINVQEVLGNDVYAALAERRRKARGRRLAREALTQAQSERAACARKAASGESENADAPPPQREEA